MSLKSITIYAYIVLHFSLCWKSNAFSTSLATEQLQRYDQCIGDVKQIGGMALPMVKTTGGSDQLSKVEALLAKAKLLRAQAEADESKLHSSLLEQKASRDMETDNMIKELFRLDNKEEITKEVIAERLTEKRLSSDMLLRVVERLHHREIAAKGLEHVESSFQESHVTFKKIAAGNKEELARVEGLNDLLIDAAKVVDENVARTRDEKGKAVMHSIDHTHWSTGELVSVLREKRKFLLREHSEQFKKRQAEYYEAASKKAKP